MVKGTTVFGRLWKGPFGTYLIVVVAYAIFQVLASAGSLPSVIVGLLPTICAYISATISLNLVVGISGELSLGHAGFMSVGAYTGIVAATCYSAVIDIPWLVFILAMLTGAVFAAIAGFVVGVPVMRLSGDYLAIVTLAFGEIIKNIMNNLYVGLDAAGLHFSFSSAQDLHMTNGNIIINGPQGAVGVEQLSTFFGGFILVLVTLAVVLNLIRSRSGRAIMAVRDNSIAAESVGINTTKYRLMAFVVASALAGMAGLMYAMNYNAVVPVRFDYNASILILVYVVLGGIGNIRGSIISATVLVVLPEVLRFMSEYRMLIYAIVLIAVMVLPNVPAVQRFLDYIQDKIPFFRSRDEVPGDVTEGAE